MSADEIESIASTIESKIGIIDSIITEIEYASIAINTNQSGAIPTMIKGALDSQKNKLEDAKTALSSAAKAARVAAERQRINEANDAKFRYKFKDTNIINKKNIDRKKVQSIVGEKFNSQK